MVEQQMTSSKNHSIIAHKTDKIHRRRGSSSRSPPRCPYGASTLSARCTLALSTAIQGGRAALRGAFDDAGPVTEPHAEENVGIREEALFEREDDELCAVGRACCAAPELVRGEKTRVPALRQPCMYILIYLISMSRLLARLCCLPYSTVEACAEECTDVLRVGQVKRSVDLVEDVHIGAGLNCSSAMISDSAMSDL